MNQYMVPIRSFSWDWHLKLQISRKEIGSYPGGEL